MRDSYLLTPNCIKWTSFILLVFAILWMVHFIIPQSVRALSHNGGAIPDNGGCNIVLEGYEQYCAMPNQSFNQRYGFDFPLPTPTPTPRPTRQPVTVDPSTPPTTKGKALVVDQTAQVVRVYEDGVEVRTLPASTGLRKSYTPPFVGNVGRYVKTMYGFGSLADHAWYLTQATGNIYIHGAPYKEVEGQKVYEGLEFLGVKPSSHGCVRIHPDDAEWLYQWGPAGVPIRVSPPDFAKFKE